MQIMNTDRQFQFTTLMLLNARNKENEKEETFLSLPKDITIDEFEQIVIKATNIIRRDLAIYTNLDGLKMPSGIILESERYTDDGVTIHLRFELEVFISSGTFVYHIVQYENGTRVVNIDFRDDIDAMCYFWKALWYGMQFLTWRNGIPMFSIGAYGGDGLDPKKIMRWKEQFIRHEYINRIEVSLIREFNISLKALEGYWNLCNRINQYIRDGIR